MFDVFIMGLWVASWVLGGIWLTGATFRLARREHLLVGMVLGLTLETLLANGLGRFLPPDPAFVVSGILTLLAGAGLAIIRDGWRSLLRLPLDWPAALGTLFLTIIFTQVGRGLAIFDDYAHLPTTSLLAAGELPLKFALNPAAHYSYHYFLLLFAAQVVRIGDLAVWFALDLARAFAFALTIALAFTWVRRMTRSIWAGVLGGLVFLFAGGSRWLALLLPGNLLETISGQVNLIGSGSASGPDFLTALNGPWIIEGGASLEFPFAFVNGILQPGVLAMLGPNSTFLLALTLTILLTCNRRRGWLAAIPIMVWVAALNLLTESGILLGLAGWGLVVVAEFVRRRKWRLPAELRFWLTGWAGGTLLGLFQGGAMTQIAVDLLGLGAAESYQTIGFKLSGTPLLVSTHLGALSLVKPATLLLALIEAGPLVFAVPLAALWGWKAFRAGHWYEAALVVSGVLSMGVLFIQFSGSTGLRNTARLYEFITLGLIYAVPLGWLWANRKGWLRRSLAMAGLFIACLGGLVSWGIELTAIPRPVYSYFINNLDTMAMAQYWDKLDPDALVFDPQPNRAPTLFARYTNSSQTWYAYKPEWLELRANPDPAVLHLAGYDYLYLDADYWEELSPAIQTRISTGCAQQLIELEDWRHDYRWLYDLRSCGE